METTHKKYSITCSFTDDDLREFANTSWPNSLKVVDALLGEAKLQVQVDTSGLSMGFGRFKGHANQHPLLNDVLAAFVDNCGGTTNWPRISAIKFIRAITNWGLKESKDFVETAVRKNGVRLF
jgi:hypothetical protein